MSRIKTVLAVSFLLLATNAVADTIEYTVENLGGDRWQYNYTLINTGADALGAFAIIFDLGVYENLFLVSAPDDWDSFVIEPDDFFPDDGYLESYAASTFLGPGDTLAGFSVSFDFLETGTPAEQFFEFFDPDTFDFISDGVTARAATSVPEPAALWLLATGLFLLATFAKRRRRPTLEVPSQ